jgi:hypothetical protein
MLHAVLFIRATLGPGCAERLDDTIKVVAKIRGA